MSYTMTINAPEKAAWFERERATMSPAELGELFVVFLAERCRRRSQRNAALAVQHNLPLATRDGHFALIPQIDRI